MMKAVVRTGGKQYLVGEGDVLDIERAPEKSGKLTFEEVLLVTSADGKEMKVGNPQVKGAKVEAELVKEHKADKLVVFKMRRRKNSRRKAGHRQQLMQVKVTKISA